MESGQYTVAYASKFDIWAEIDFSDCLIIWTIPGSPPSLKNRSATVLCCLDHSQLKQILADQKKNFPYIVCARVTKRLEYGTSFRNFLVGVPILVLKAGRAQPVMVSNLKMHLPEL